MEKERRRCRRCTSGSQSPPPRSVLVYLNNARRGGGLSLEMDELQSLRNPLRGKWHALARAAFVTTEGIHLPRACSAGCHFSGDIYPLRFRFFDSFTKKIGRALHKYTPFTEKFNFRFSALVLFFSFQIKERCILLRSFFLCKKKYMTNVQKCNKLIMIIFIISRSVLLYMYIYLLKSFVSLW